MLNRVIFYLQSVNFLFLFSIFILPFFPEGCNDINRFDSLLMDTADLGSVLFRDLKYNYFLRNDSRKTFHKSPT